MIRKLEENKKNQRIFDQYLDLAVINPNIFVRCYRGYDMFVSGHNTSKAFRALSRLGSSKIDEIKAGKSNGKFYEGHFRYCCIVIPAGVFVAVRIHTEIFYTGVKNKDRRAVLDIARKTHCTYDLRALPIQAIARKAKNVIHLAF